MTTVAGGRREITGRLLKLSDAGQLGQSFIFAGPDGSGKEATALELARLLNCSTPETCLDRPACESCRKAIGFQHPDIRWIGPAPASISEDDIVDLLAEKQDDPFFRPAYAAASEVLIGDPDHPGPLSVRALLQFLRLRPFQGTHKVAIIADAHRLRSGAANAFLKMLEEPPDDSLIILLSSRSGSILPTIRSRCQQIVFNPYPRAELAALLRSVYAMPAKEAERLADIADGDVRRASRLRRPEPRVLQAWAGDLFAAIHDGRRSYAHITAEMLHKGVLPEDLVARENETADRADRIKTAPLKELPRKRERAIQLCDALNLHYAGLLESLVPDPADAGTPARPQGGPGGGAARRSIRTLVADINLIDDARRDIDRNLNIGLMMAVLFQELITRAEADAPAERSR